MEENLEPVSYISCGEILVAHSLTNKEEYFLKCNNCDEGYSLLEDFITHHQYYHKEVKSELEDEEDLEFQDMGACDDDTRIDKDEDMDEGQIEYLEDIEYADNEEYNEDINTNAVQCKEERNDDIIEDIKVQIEHEIDNRKINDSQDYESQENEENDYAEDDNNTADEEDPLEDETLQDDDDDDDDDNDKTYEEDENANYSASDEEFEPRQDSKTRHFVGEFLKKEQHYLSFIAAYKNQPRLWNYKIYPKKFKSKKERDSFLLKIANDMRNRINVTMSCDDVSAVIKRIRQDYRDKLKRGQTNDKDPGREPKSKRSVLEFLDPFLDCYSIFKLDTHRALLKKEEILDILCIYRRYPYLWNSNLSEYVCSNKRSEALKQMTEAVRLEMNLDINENALKKYLLSVHSHCSKDKGNALIGKETSGYYNHMKFLHRHVGPFCCSDCGRKNRNPLQFRIHKYLNHGGEPLKCPQCGKVYEALEPYIAHSRRHMNDLRAKCKECGKMFMRAADVRIHMRTHTGAKPYFCEICGSSFTMPSSLKEHRRRHDKLYKVFCEICARGFYSNDKLVAHMDTHSDIRKYACKKCGKAFKTKKTLRAHEHTHEEGRNYPCPMCGKMYKNRIGVAQHLRTHRSNAETKSNPFLEK
ncbi:uncharacterized protein LOC142228473 [Haematobia irritans]|uniref:uncharacterized protein LOC142228473 n=1 Tax=Haematobia irritans TaxID=7368 RepID=UPI003F4F75CE